MPVIMSDRAPALFGEPDSMGASTSSPSASATSITRTFSRLLKFPLPESTPSAELFSDLFPTDLSVDADTLFRVVSPYHVLELSTNLPRSLARLIFHAADILTRAAAAPDEAGVCCAINAARLLARLVPPLLGSNAEFVSALFWENLEPSAATEDGASADATAAAATATWVKSARAGESPLGVDIVNATLRLLFSPFYSVSDVAHKVFETVAGATDGATSATPASVCDTVWPMLLWAPGCGARDVTPPPPPASIVAARVDLLRLLIALLSSPLYSDARTARRCPFAHALTGGAAPFAPCLFFSLLNTAFPNEASYPDPLAIGGDTNTLASLSAHTLLALVDYYPPESSVPTVPDSTNTAAIAAPNLFRGLLSGLQPGPDIDCIFEGVARALASVAAAADADIIGGSGGALAAVVTAVGLGGARAESAGVTPAPLLMLWMLLEMSPAFCARILSADGRAGARIGAPLVTYLNATRMTDDRAPAAQLALLLLARLSGDRRFAVSLNALLPASVPTDFPLLKHDARVIDAVVITTLRVVDDSSPRLAPLAPLALAVLCNVTPFAKDLSESACTRFLDVLESLTAAPVTPANISLASTLLSALRALVDHQSEINSALLDSILRRAKLFTYTIRALVVDPNVKAALDGDLAPILAIITYFAPRITAAVDAGDAGAVGLDNEGVIALLKRETLVGVLPPPLPICIRPYVPMENSGVHKTVLLWTSIFIAQGAQVSLFDHASAVKLFKVRIAEPRPAP